jgi:hypothetical protein
MPKFWRLVHFQLTKLVVIILTVNRYPCRYLGVVHSMSAGSCTLNVATYIGLYLYFFAFCYIYCIHFNWSVQQHVYIYVATYKFCAIRLRELRMGCYESSYFLVGCLGGSSWRFLWCQRWDAGSRYHFNIVLYLDAEQPSSPVHL